MRIALIAAMAANGVIGRDNQMPWHLPEDLKMFKRTTLGKPVIMGRKTFESIGRPLPGRTNIVLSRQAGWQADGVRTAPDLVSALAIASELTDAVDGEVMVIGGEQIYRQALPLAERLYLTYIDIEVSGDSYFPPFDRNQWRQLSRTEGRSESQQLAFSFVVWERLRGNAVT